MCSFVMILIQGNIKLQSTLKLYSSLLLQLVSLSVSIPVVNQAMNELVLVDVHNKGRNTDYKAQLIIRIRLMMRKLYHNFSKEIMWIGPMHHFEKN